MNKSSVRRALTTLKKQGVITEVKPIVDSVVYITLTVDAELIQPKKKVYIKKVKKAAPKKQFTIVGDVFKNGALIINNNYKK